MPRQMHIKYLAKQVRNVNVYQAENNDKLDEKMTETSQKLTRKATQRPSKKTLTENFGEKDVIISHLPECFQAPSVDMSV